jgi:hypothetical protein
LSEIDIEQPRDAATGQFASASSGVHGWIPPTDVGEVGFGLESVERSSGYVPNVNAHVTDDVTDDLADEAIATAALYPADADEPVVDGIVEASAIPAALVDRATGEKLPDHITMTESEAGDGLANYESNLASYIEGDDLANLAEIVDQARAEVLKSDPQLAKDEFGLTEADIPAAQQSEAQPQAQAEPPQIEGVDPEISRAIQIPKVREFLETAMQEGENARQQYVQGLNIANQLGMARLNELLPDIGRLPTVEQRMGALQMLAQSDPARYQAAMHEMNRIGQIQAAQGEQNQYSAARAQQEFQTWAKAEDKQVGDISAADARAVQDYLPVIGLDQNSYVRLLASDKMARSAIGQRLMIDAARGHAIKNAPKAVPTRQPQSVQRPGISGGRTSQSESMAQLERNLARSGSEADGWALLQAKMRG